MRNTLLFIFFCCGLLSACKSDSNKNSSQSDSSDVKIDPFTPHEVGKGDGGDYAFKPDTSVQKIILGNPDCLKTYFLENGFHDVSLGGNRKAMDYYNSSVGIKHLMELRTTKNKKGETVVYEIIVQRSDDPPAPQLATKAIPSSDFNFVSGHGISIGMTIDYVMSIYSNQKFMEVEKGDTVYLTYTPKPKDYNFFKRYHPAAYSVVYKFKNETLRRMEYSVDPKEFE